MEAPQQRGKAARRGLSIERFASGKDGQTNAFKKRLAAKQRSIIHNAQLKRKYAKVLKAEFGESALRGPAPITNALDYGVDDDSSPSPGRGKKRRRGYRDTEEPETDGDQMVATERSSTNGFSSSGKRGLSADATESSTAEAESTPGPPYSTSQSGGDARQRQRQRRKPDPFASARAAAQAAREAAEARRREREEAEKAKEKRIGERKRQRAMLSKRTKKGQPIMKNTMNLLLQKIQKQAG